jgi:predicted RNase H-like HicB family nuclease
MPMPNRTYAIRATWDNEARVWVADSDDIPGIAAEAEDREALQAKLSTLIPEMVALNNVGVDQTQPLEIVIHYHREERIKLPVAA